MKALNFNFTSKQLDALDKLFDKTTTDIVFGGGAGGGKSYLGCAFVLIMCYKYAGCRILVGREELARLKESTLLTFFGVLAEQGLVAGKDFTYNGQDYTFTFHQTKSTVYFKELKNLPSDPNFDRLGSTEFTFAFVDEAQEIVEKCINVIKTRLRYKITEFGIIPKILMTCNPGKNFLYTVFYKPFKENILDKAKAFIQSLAIDNEYVDGTYIENLKNNSDKNIKERLLFGNWEYDDDPSQLCQYDDILNMFSLRPLVRDGKRYIIADIARFGGDKIVIGYFDDFICKEIKYFTKQDLVVTKNEILKMATKYNVGIQNILVDEDGVGGGVKDMIGCKGFINNSTALNSENYINLKTQCAYKLAEKVNKGEFGIVCEDGQVKEWIIEEVEQLKSKNADKDRKLQIQDKDYIKSMIGRSPDFLDMLTMRMYFEIKAQPYIMFV